jgi:hypothetical protein
VLAFWLLILFHAGLGFVGWDVYAYRNNQTSELLEVVLLFVNQWRLPVLFVVSGMGTRYALSRRSPGQFLGERSKRLLIPLVFGANFVVLFQGYYAALHKGGIQGFLPFALGWWRQGGEVQHLWFVLWLFGYSLMAAPLLVYLRNRPTGRVLRAFRRLLNLPFGVGLLAVLPAPLILVEWIFKPVAPGPIVGYMIPWYFVFFVAGFMFASVGRAFWQRVGRMRVVLSVLGILTFGLMLITLVLLERVRPGRAETLISGGWVQQGLPHLDPFTAGFGALHAANAWIWCLAVFAWGNLYLSRPNRILAYCNRAVYCFYIAHQPLTLVALYYLKDLDLWWPGKLCAIVVYTFLGCWAVYELAKRTAATRLVFGIKPATGARSSQAVPACLWPSRGDGPPAVA